MAFPIGRALTCLSVLLLFACTDAPAVVSEPVQVATTAPTSTARLLPTSVEQLGSPTPQAGETSEQQASTAIPTPTVVPTPYPQFAGGSHWLARVPGVRFNFLNTTRDGGYLLLGTLGSNRNPQSVLIRLSDRGAIVWQRHFASGVPYFSGALETEDDGIVLTDMWGLTKLDPNGEFQWYQSLSSGSEVPLLRMAMNPLQSSEPGSAGQTLAIDGGGIYILDGEGALVGQRILASVHPQDRSTSWMTGAARWSAGMEGNQRFWVVRNGLIGPSWMRTFDFSNFDITLLVPPELVLGTSEGGAVLVAPVRNLIRPGFAIWVARMDRQGNVLWETALDGVDEEALTVHEAPDGGLLIASLTRFFPRGSPGNYLRIVRLDADGTQRWDRFYGDGQWQAAPGAIVDGGDGGFLIAGEIVSSGEGMDGSAGDTVLLKVDGEGNVPGCPWATTSAYGAQQLKSPDSSHAVVSAGSTQEVMSSLEKLQPSELEVVESQAALVPYCAAP